ncbi:hypothetical protein CPAST_c27200 [Clostridium pasteurianum DSM 525 = ATCC 6013]|uniref:DUF4350 domain-containing protein n=1 Tax=Clostridium pasteurianum DSM 525 = ATCC 6013 TaxID=1262449 RepID=A0A0H3J6H3_CLOPA|nr:DUF4350 domain-containing protein [Clostridium pasteurianum]AJA48787.1 hypothetical protein CPAST_c27200 [Clostridium pasteurianum DSM 525 = ATCC 6013]AJA52775.1 hypothetical protein CLPA_c27200 [Clostridium pasteurianum DSM 525 = ATCC 6013]AOZ76008.1 hypothetical protein AQ983_13220 [Clostridium pasteurianum DSM 525 = ATCC 6013]AOZ79804.1 hypothetical protein AQ984_13215 [Clostridium pasteurianum]ELP60085.1 hypothetical protein F502_05597 [Clostridium pasteurianum DSM 525 = ATCC 6013]
MKTKISRDLILFIIFIPVFLIITFYVSSRMQDKMPSYSVSNKSKFGISVFYEAMKKLDYPVERTLKPVNTFSTDNIQIVPAGGDFDINSDDIKNWINKGGKLIYIAPESIHFINYAVPQEEKGDFTVYKYGKGNIITYNSSNITNKTLMVNTNKAYEFLKEIDRYSYNKIYFNENYLFSLEGGKSLWDYVPLQLRYFIYQILIIVVAFFYYKGKRFGRSIPLYEEIERSENEYLYSAASLYRSANCWDIMLENYYESFLRQINCSHENWLHYWGKKEFDSLEQAKKVYKFIDKKDKKLKSKECMSIIASIENLKNIEKQRRDSYWKIIKKSL